MPHPVYRLPVHVGPIEPLGGGAPLGWANARGLVDPAWAPEPGWAGAHVAWSGSLGDGLFEADPRTWGPAGRAALEGARRRAAELGATICIRPHARHVVSDIPSCQRWLGVGPRGEALAAGGGLLLDPCAMLTARMLRDHADFLRRAVETLAPLAGVVGVVVCDVAVDEEPAPGPDGGPDGGPDSGPDGGPPLRAVPLGRGVLERGLLVDLVRRAAPGAALVVLAEEDRAGAAALASG